MSRDLFKRISLLQICLIVAACETPTAVELPPNRNPVEPMLAKRAVVGDKFHFVTEDGREGIATVNAVSGSVIEMSSDFPSSGETCSWKEERDTLAPWIEWTNCGSTGRIESSRIGGSAFPLAEGKTESWKFEWTNRTGQSWPGTRRCRVDANVNITVPAGNFDAHHVVCEDQYWLRETFYSADGLMLRFVRTRKAGNQDQNINQLLTKFVPAET